METEMKTLLATAALLVAIASPALAQSYDPDIGSGNLHRAPYASSQNNPIHSGRTNGPHRRTVRRAAPSEAYAQSPEEAFPRTPAFGNGYRLPGAKYDAYGYYVDPNSPGRW
jgi:hypothetical protein